MVRPISREGQPREQLAAARLNDARRAGPARTLAADQREIVVTLDDRFFGDTRDQVWHGVELSRDGGQTWELVARALVRGGPVSSRTLRMSLDTWDERPGVARQARVVVWRVTGAPTLGAEADI